MAHPRLGFTVRWVAVFATGLALQAIPPSAAANGSVSSPKPKPKPKPTLSVVGSGDTRIVRFDGADARGRLGELTLLLRLEGGDGEKPEVRFFPTAPGASSTRPLRLNRPQEGSYPSEEPRVATIDGKSPILTEGTNIVRFQFGLATKASPEAADGLLQLDLEDVSLVQVPVAGAPPKAALAPSPVKLEVTRGVDLGFVDWDANDDEETVSVTGPGSAGVMASPDMTTTLQGDGGEEANARLTFGNHDGRSGQSAGTVSVSGWSAVGSYSGALQLDQDSATPTSLPVQLKVRDSIVWPIFFVLLGALIGGVGVRAYGLRRRRELLRGELKAANERYEASEKQPHLYLLTDDLLGGIRAPTKHQCKRQPSSITGDFGKLYCDIHKAKTDPDFNDVTSRARDVLARFEHWQDFRGESERLRDALKSANPARGSAARDDADALIRAVQAEPPADKAAPVLAAFRHYRQILRAYRRLDDRFEALGPAEQQRLSRYRADNLYEVIRPTDDLDATRAWQMLNIMDAAYEALAHPALAPHDPPGAPTSEEAEQERQFVQTLGLRPGRGLELLESAGGAARVDRRSAQAILSSLRRWDWVLGLGTAVLTVVAYVAGVYTDTYGGWLQYATAFAAGFFGQAALATLAAAIAQLPLFQSYRISPRAPVT
jgi:hypothetical protein